MQRVPLDTNRRDMVHDFACVAAETTYEDLPADVIEIAKMSIIDTIGVALAASGLEPAVEAVTGFVAESGDAGDSHQWATGAKAAAPMAALSNGALAHCLDFDDQTAWGQHSASSIVPAVLAVAEQRGGVSGRDLITAVALGQDFFARFRRNVGWRKDWNLSTVLGVFAGTLAAGRALGFERSQHVSALSVASMHSAGVMEVVAGRGSNLRGMYAGFSAKGSVMSALLARRGITGVSTLFEGEYGFLHTYFDGEYDRDGILDGLGTDFQGVHTQYKWWPTVGTAHSHVQAVISIMRDHNIHSHDIAELRPFVGDYHDLMCEPIDERRSPATLVDAKFSLPYIIAVAASKGDVTLRDFTSRALADANVRAMAERVVPISDPSLDWSLELPIARVLIITKDGREFDARGVKVPGGPDAPLDWSQIAQKFMSCVSVAANPISEGAANDVIRLTRDLHSVEDVTALVTSLHT